MTILAIALLAVSCSSDNQTAPTSASTIQNPPPTSKSKEMADLKKKNKALTQEILDLKKDLPKQVMREYRAKQDSIENLGIIQDFHLIDFSGLGIDSLWGISYSDVLHVLQQDGSMGNIEWYSRPIKRVYEKSGFVAGKLSRPQNLESFYKLNKEVLGFMMRHSEFLRDVYRDSEIVSNYFSGNISAQKSQFFENYFESFDGAKVSAYSFTSQFTGSMYEEDSDSRMYADVFKQYYNIYGGNTDDLLAGQEYMLWLFVKRQRVRFSEEWCQTAAKILRDFGEVEAL